jgi:Holliday junction DNA helicase RuvB
VSESQSQNVERDHTQPGFTGDIFDVIDGYSDIKGIILCSLAAERPVHILLCGPPATAKSLFLMELGRLSGARFAVGSSTTRAGLTRFLVESRPKYLLMDELDKLEHRKDYSALLSVMEQGIVSELKTGRTKMIHLKTWVFATANYEKNIPLELRSRFLIFRLKPYSRKAFAKVTKRILVTREGKDIRTASYIARKVAEKSRDVRDAIKVARLANSSKEARQIFQTMTKYR